MAHTTFGRSLAALAHPVTLVAVLLLLANDHLFEVLWPSWGPGSWAMSWAWPSCHC